MAQAIEMRVASCGANSRDHNTQEQCGQELEAHFRSVIQGTGRTAKGTDKPEGYDGEKSCRRSAPRCITRHRRCTPRCESEGLQASCSRSMSFTDKSGDGKLVTVA